LIDTDTDTDTDPDPDADKMLFPCPQRFPTPPHSPTPTLSFPVPNASSRQRLHLNTEHFSFSPVRHLLSYRRNKHLTAQPS
jgi:hypothetical protein